MTKVVFDVGNVLIRWEPWNILAGHLPQDRIEPFMTDIGFGPWNVEQDRGRTWDEAVALKVAEFPQHAALIERFHTHWHDAVPGPIEDSVAALRALHGAGEPVYGITNFSAEKWAECQDRFDFLNLFTDVVVSAHERIIKPDPTIFRLFLDRNGLSAEDCLFIDDSEKNIAAASGIGMQTMHFDGSVAVTKALQVKGLLP